MATSHPSDILGDIYSAGLHEGDNFKPDITWKADQWQPLAKEVLPKDSWGYVHGSAGTGATDAANKAAFARWGIIPSRLVKFEEPDMSTTVLGKRLPFPIALAPVGVLEIFHKDKEIGTARAATACKVPYTMSTASATSIEEVAEASGEGERWYQLYWPQRADDDITLSILKRAKASGFSALVVTLDTYILGWRPDDLDNGYNPFLKPDTIGVAIGMSDPVFQAAWKEKHGKLPTDDLANASPAWAHTVFPGASHTWEDVEWLKTVWDGPIVLKGIQTVSDARKAADLGLAGIIVSNHGGRQVDGCVPSLDCLPPIVDAVGTRIDVMYDSGVRTGADVVKALALGAKLVFIGRPYVYGLALGGGHGVKHVLQALLGDLDLTLRLSGIPSVHPRDLNTDSLRRISA